VALLLSGLSTATYTFKGFPPRKSGARQRFLAMERDLPHTLVLFESPYRVGKLLADALTALGDRQAAVCVELTKKFQAVHRGYLSDLAAQFAGKEIKGEIAVVIAGNHPKFQREEAEAPKK
jgi:16S rRNA (cytidine1402-2'-O)-methyltransferase